MRIQPSSRIVGYQNIDLPKGFSLYTVTFKKIGGGSYSIDDILPKKDGVQLANGQLSFQKCDEKGAYTTTHTWMPLKGGWCIGVNKAEGVTIEDGQAVCFNAKQEGVSIQVSGEVEMNPVSMTLVKGFNLVGNMTPNEIDLQDITPIKDGVQVANGQISLQKCDTTGAYTTTYTWLPMKDGWCEGVNKAVGVTFKPGEAFCSNAKQDGITLKFKSPIAE